MKPEEIENEHVHKVYDQIADHFSSTRYKPWPVVEEYLKNQEKNSFGADIGCGNGKYIKVNPDLLIIGSDR
jgi:tRNA (uracil-5-)-methyltransferase TRM9